MNTQEYLRLKRVKEFQNLMKWLKEQKEEFKDLLDSAVTERMYVEKRENLSDIIYTYEQRIAAISYTISLIESLEIEGEENE